MIECVVCHATNKDDSPYCERCGSALIGLMPRVRATVIEGEEVALDAAPKIENYASGEMPQPSENNLANDNSKAHNGERARVAAARRVLDNSGASVKTPHAKLVIERGQSAGKEFFLNDEETHIGRWDADGGIFPEVDLDTDDREAKVSRRHARIIRRGNEYAIEDLGSINGTFVNRGRRLTPGSLQPVDDGDEIIVGKIFLRLQLLK